MAKTKTDNVSIRFDSKQLEFLKEREKIDSHQRVVNFLMNKYWFENFTHDGNKTSSIKSVFVNPSTIIENQFDIYKKEIDETTYSGDLESIMKCVKVDKSLTASEKINLEYYATEHAKDFNS